MEVCFCCERAWYFCKPCKAYLCEEHKQFHEKIKKNIHTFEELGIKLNPEKITKVTEDLTKKIHVLSNAKFIL